MQLPFPAYLLQVKDHYNKLVDMMANFRRWFYTKVTFIIENSNIRMLWRVTISICCNGVWPCFMFLKILFSFGSQLILSSCILLLLCVNAWKQEFVIIPFSISVGMRGWNYSIIPFHGIVLKNPSISISVLHTTLDFLLCLNEARATFL